VSGRAQSAAMRRSVAIVLFVALSACGGYNGGPVATRSTTCDDVFRALNLTAAARPGCLAQSIRLSGELNGSVAQAYVPGMCTTPKRWDNFPTARLMLAVGNKAYRLTISPPGASEHQRVSFKQVSGRVELASVADPAAHWHEASGSLAVNADGVSGKLAVDLLRDAAGAQPVHVTGQWACGAEAVPIADPKVPCSLFYALNRLQSADVARMRASACLAEDLTFSGAISGHVDHAINDAPYAREPGIDGDNNCLAIGDQYDASLKFSIGDESFLLNLNPRAYPRVGPGRYAANALLWLGNADPAHNGLFVTDPHVYWFGSSGSFVIAGDMRSGTIDETFTGMSGHPESTVRIAGGWRCA
jgi:hypothetical protein